MTGRSDRAAVVARQIMLAVGIALEQALPEIEQMLREEFTDVQREIAAEREPPED